MPHFGAAITRAPAASCSAGWRAVKEPYRAIYDVTERESSRYLRCYFPLPMENPIVSAQAKREYVQAIKLLMSNDLTTASRVLLYRNIRE